MKLLGDGHTGITCFSRVCDQGVLVQLSGLVVGGLQNGGTSHRSLGGRDQGEVLARDSQQNLPANIPLERTLEVEFSGRADLHCVCSCVVELAGEKRYVGGGGLLVEQAPPDGSLRELPACLSSGLPPGSEQTNAARACLGHLANSLRRQASQSWPALAQVPWYL